MGLVDVGSAHRHGSYSQQHIVIANLWNRNFAERDRMRLDVELDNG
jgi:hypothetical protein